MEYKYQAILGGRAALSALSEGHTETTSYMQTKNNLEHVGLGTGSALLDQRRFL
jgi:hypothetical protein